MRNFDLEADISKTIGDLGVTRSEAMTYQSRLRERNLEESDRLRYEGERLKLHKNMLSLQHRMNLLRQKESQLTITSPIDGQVNEWMVHELLVGRVVQQGNRLMTIADPRGDWEVELKMDEDRMGHIAEARQELGKDLPVTYYVATDPGDEHEGHVKEVHSSAEARAEQGNTVLVKVAIDKNDLHDPFPGATVTAKVYCGRASLGYVWLHDLIAFVQTRILFRL